ncbi:MAG: protein arginine N-methyltransferase, partial [Pseudomonadota bacterium]
DTWHLLGVMANDAGQWEEALVAYDRAIEGRSDEPTLYCNRGSTQQSLNHLDAAIADYRRALVLDPYFLQAWSYLAAALYEHGDFKDSTDAVTQLQHTIAAKPNDAHAYYNLGMAFLKQNQYQDAVAAYQRAVEIDPNYVAAHWDMAFPLLGLGRLQEGWDAHEWRWKVHPILQPLPYPEWEGTSLKRKTILVYAEQGLGDELLFASCLPDLIRQSDHCVIECEPRLALLYSRSFPSATVRGARRHDHLWLNSVPGCDVQCAIGSLSHYLRRKINQFPTRQTAYLFSEPEACRTWHAWLNGLEGKIKIGICWRSALMKGERYKHYTRLEQWGSILAIPGVTFVNLQYDDCADELIAAEAQFGVTLHRPPGLDLCNDIDGVAAMITALDLVIGAGTVVTVLAGALGVPTWRYASAPAWIQLGTDHLPWMPSVKLFIKNHPETDWEPMLIRISQALADFAAQKPIRSTSAKLHWVHSMGLTNRKLTATGASNLLAIALNHYHDGHLVDATTWCQRILRDLPNHSDTWHLLGVMANDAGQWEDALVAYDRAIEGRSDEPTLYCNRGSARQSAKRLNDAIVDYQCALALDPGFQLARNYLAAALYEQGDYAGCAEEYREVLRRDRTDAIAFNGLGMALSAQHQYEDALICHQEALKLHPDFPEALSNLGSVYRELHRLPEAEEALRKAIHLRPEFVEALNNLGNTLRDSNQLGEAESVLREALRLRPDCAMTHSNLGNVLKDRGRFAEAIASYRRSVELQSDAQVHWNLAHTLLAHGKLAEGWAGIDWRWQALIQEPCNYPYLEWDGTATLAGRTLLVYAEQGVGEELLFASCFPDLINQAGHVVIECDRRLQALFQRSFPAATVVGATRNDHDWSKIRPIINIKISAGTLVRFLRPTIESFPDRLAYLIPDSVQLDHWRARLAALGPGLKVGIAWRSHLATGERARYYSRLDQWGEIFAVPGVHFVNLQYDECRAELAAAQDRFGIRIHTFADLDLFNDLDGAAAYTAALDLVIATASATSAMAGALGVPTWRPDAGYAWPAFGTGRMPWQPSMRLFIKPAVDDPWEPILTDISRELRQRVSSSMRIAYVTKGIPKKADTLAQCRYGLMVFSNQDSPVGIALAQYGEYAESEVALFRSLVRPGDLVVEVQAGIGTHTLALSQMVGDAGWVVAWESEPYTFRLLCANLALNAVERVLTLPDHLEQSPFQPSIPTTDWASDLASWIATLPMKHRTVDALALPRCDLLKMPYYESWIVLAGASKTLARYKPFLYICDWPVQGDGTFLATLTAQGYAWQAYSTPGFSPDNYAGKSVDALANQRLSGLLAFPSVV